MAKPGTLDLSVADRVLVQQILSQYVPGRCVFVFGSRSNGRASQFSDLDLAFEGPLSLQLRGELAEAFNQSDLPIEVDVVDLASVSDTFRKRVMSEWIPFEFSPPVVEVQNEVHA